MVIDRALRKQWDAAGTIVKPSPTNSMNTQHGIKRSIHPFVF